MKVERNDDTLTGPHCAAGDIFLIGVRACLPLLYHFGTLITVSVSVDCLSSSPPSALQQVCFLRCPRVCGWHNFQSAVEEEGTNHRNARRSVSVRSFFLRSQCREVLLSPMLPGVHISRRK